jgi:hypothetical protein
MNEILPADSIYLYAVIRPKVKAQSEEGFEARQVFTMLN